MRDSTPFRILPLVAALMILGGAAAQARQPEVSRAERAILARLTWETNDLSLCQLVTQGREDLERLREQVEEARAPARESAALLSRDRRPARADHHP